jgi:hypothetical protein
MLEAYFYPLEELQNQDQSNVKLSADGTLLISNVPFSRVHFISDSEQVGKYAARIKQLEDANGALSDENDRQRKQFAAFRRVDVTLEQARVQKRLQAG